MGNPIRDAVRRIQKKFGHEDYYGDAVSQSVPLFSDREDFEGWRNDMLQNKKPWGMVPLAEVYNEDWGQHIPTTWGTPGAEPFPLYTTPERAGLEGLFAENPELNYQNPSNQMFPWQPNYPAIYAADKYINEKTIPPGWTEEDLKKQPGLPFGKAIDVWDASPWFREQERTEGPFATAGGINFGDQGIVIDTEGAAMRADDWESYFNEIYRNVVPHEFGHELDRDPEMWKVLPYPQTSGVNPGTGEFEKRHGDDIFLHDILYNMGPQYSPTHPRAGVPSHTRYIRGPAGNSSRIEEKWGNEFASLDRAQAMNYAALQNFSRKAVNNQPHSYRSNQSWNMDIGDGPTREGLPPGPREGRPHHFNTGGIASLMV